MTSKNATHKTPRSPSLSLNYPIAFFFSFSHTLSSRTFPPSALLSARKLSLLVSLIQNANLISKLWTIAKLLFLHPRRLTKKKKLDFFPLLSVPVFSSRIRYVDGTDAKIHPKFADFVPQLFFCLHRTQKTSVLNATLLLLLI